jgi:hypothetical protein
MIKITRTITLNGDTKEDYNQIIDHLINTKAEETGWTLIKEPLTNKVTAVKKEEINQL